MEENEFWSMIGSTFLTGVIIGFALAYYWLKHV